MPRKYQQCFGSDDDDDDDSVSCADDDSVILKQKTDDVKQLKDDSTKRETVVVNRYVIKRKLGNGSFGVVYLVSDIKENNELKVIKKIPVGDMNQDETFEAVKEARLQAKLFHAGIVKFYDCFISSNAFCIVTVYCEGGDLCDEITRHRKKSALIADTTIDKWIHQLLSAVQYLHAKYVIHRDLKTRNIFLKDGNAMIGDFGISKTLSDTAELAMTFTGTPYYMSPEVLKHEGYSTRSDIWSLGVILFELCTLKRPFEGRNIVEVMVQIASKNIPCLQRSGRKFQDICTRMLCRDPNKRPTAEELLQIYAKKETDDQQIETARLNIDINVERNEEQTRLQTRQTRKMKMEEPQRPMTPKERLVQRKQSRADEEAKRLRKITISSYEESRRICSQTKNKQNKSSTQFPWQNKSHDTEVKFLEHSESIQEQPHNEYMYDDDTFESDSSSNNNSSDSSRSISDDEHDAMHEYMAAALEMTPDDSHSSGIDIMQQKTLTLRKQRIMSLERESRNLLGEKFNAVYEFLKEARFEGDESMSESTIMARLKELVERPRDCFLVDQLLFLEKQEEIIIII